MSLNDRSSSLHDRRSSKSSSRRVSAVSSIFPPLHRFPYRNSPLNSPSEISLTASRENLPETTDQGSTRDSTVRSVEELAQQSAQSEHDQGEASTIGPLNPPWSPSLKTSTVDTTTFCASPEPMTTSEASTLHRSPSVAESYREPRLSWMVTLLLLTVVTIVSNE